MIDYINIGVNPAKHDYANDRGPVPLFVFEDALYAHFLARRFGAIALEAVGKLHLVVSSAEQAAKEQAYFRGDPLTGSLARRPTHQGACCCRKRRPRGESLARLRDALDLVAGPP